MGLFGSELIGFLPDATERAEINDDESYRQYMSVITVVAESLFFQNYFAKNYLGCAWPSNLKLSFANRGNLAKDFLLKEFFQFSEFCGCRITFLSIMKTSRPVARD